MQLQRIVRPRARATHAFTLVELVIVVLVIGVVAGLVVMTSSGSILSSAQNDVTLASMDQVRSAIWGKDPTHPSGYGVDMRTPPLAIRDLLVRGTQAPYDFERRRGWRGPYLSSNAGRFESMVANPSDPDDAPLDVSFAPYGTLGDPAPLDGYGHPIVVQIPDSTDDGAFDETELAYARLVSAGPDGIIQTPRTDAQATLPGNALLPRHEDCGDDLVLYLRAADTRP